MDLHIVVFFILWDLLAVRQAFVFTKVFGYFMFEITPLLSTSMFPLTPLCFFSRFHSLLALSSLTTLSTYFSYSLSLSPHALRSTTQQPLNYSHQTTLCISCAVPLHPPRIFPVSHGCLREWMCVCVCACGCAQLRVYICMCSRLCVSASIFDFSASLDGSLYPVSNLCLYREHKHSCTNTYIHKHTSIYILCMYVCTQTHIHTHTHTHIHSWSKTVGLYVVISPFLLLWGVIVLWMNKRPPGSS